VQFCPLTLISCQPSSQCRCCWPRRLTWTAHWTVPFQRWDRPLTLASRELPTSWSMLASSGTYSTSRHATLQFKQGYCLHACICQLTDVHGAQLRVKSACKSSWSKSVWSHIVVSRAVLRAILMAGHTAAIGLSGQAAAVPCSSQCTCSACSVVARPPSTHGV